MTVTAEAIEAEMVSEDRLRELKDRLIREEQALLARQGLAELYRLYRQLKSRCDGAFNLDGLNEREFARIEGELRKVQKQRRRFHQRQLEADDPQGLFEVFDVNRLRSWQDVGKLSEVLVELDDDPTRTYRIMLLDFDGGTCRAWERRNRIGGGFVFPELECDGKGYWRPTL